ncbi:MAG: HAMP domain-containing sensor histidine kinase [Pseudomonadales bacterium]
MTPEAVIDRYLETATREPFDAAAFVLLVGTDADLLSRWLQLLSCPADPDAFASAVSALPSDRFHDLAMSQALAVLTVSGSVRLSFDQWQSVLNSSLVSELLAVELGLPNPVAVRWRVLLAASGVNLEQDPLLMELLAFRGARRELLEDASAIHRLFAVVESLDVNDPLVSQETAEALLEISPERYQALVQAAESRCAELLGALGLSGERDFDSAERLWLRMQVGILGRLFPDGSGAAGGSTAAAESALHDIHALVSRRLFGRVPDLFILDDSGIRLRRLACDGPDISLRSQSSSIARSARLGERTELIDRTDQSVADRQVLRHLGSAEGVCLPLVQAGGRVVGVMICAVDEDVDHETAMALYADELARRLVPRRSAAAGDRDPLGRFRQREEKRLRELVHEVNNPLAIVNNYLHILELKLAHEPEAVEQLRTIGTELRRASELIARAREVPELEAERPESGAEFTDLDVNALASQVVELHLGYAQEQQVQLTEQLLASPAQLRSDEQRLAQILNNLVRNAIEAAHGASVSVSTVSGVYRESRAGMLLEVSDTGPGLPPEVLERLAEPKESSKGGDHSGLGLHIVHRLVAEIGGNIDVRTAPGQGTRFSIFLPLDPGARV